MQVTHFSVSGLGGIDRNISVSLNPDLNILTGKNGSGKTTALKLIWYVLSGNIERAISEVQFTNLTVETTAYKISISRPTKLSAPEIQVWSGGNTEFFEQHVDEDGDQVGDPVDDANDAVKDFGSSVFFPTFRRIEGGFSIKAAQSTPRTGAWISLQPGARSARSHSPLEEAMQDLSRRLTVGNHTFVASISTVDIVQLLMRQYTEMSERSNRLQQQTSQEIIDQIKNYKQDKAKIFKAADNPEKILDNIKSTIEQLDVQRDEILAPLTAVQVLATQLFQHAGIRLGTKLDFGDAAKAISSEMLSAGEKQMLSFICYNAFIRESVIFIDEPELSLHVDWQRQLFSILQAQGTSNQFIIATHSPFIYGKFPEKEILINEDRGDQFGTPV